MNVVVLRGRLSRPAEQRELPSGETLVQLEITILRPGEKAETAPVVWHNAPPSATTLDVDQEVVVLGRVRRRFFRAGGSTQSRTEVVAEQVVVARQAKKVSGLFDRARALVDGSADQGQATEAIT
jgi:single-strand DNA-binding protein